MIWRFLSWWWWSVLISNNFGFWWCLSSDHAHDFRLGSMIFGWFQSVFLVWTKLCSLQVWVLGMELIGITIIYEVFVIKSKNGPAATKLFIYVHISRSNGCIILSRYGFVTDQSVLVIMVSFQWLWELTKMRGLELIIISMFWSLLVHLLAIIYLISGRSSMSY